MNDLVNALEVVWDGIKWVVPHCIVIGGAYFLSVWVAMFFWGLVAAEIGVTSLAYLDAMLGMVAVWLTVILVLIVVGRVQNIFRQIMNRTPGRYLE